MHLNVISEGDRSVEEIFEERVAETSPKRLKILIHRTWKLRKSQKGLKINNKIKYIHLETFKMVEE